MARVNHCTHLSILLLIALADALRLPQQPTRRTALVGAATLVVLPATQRAHADGITGGAGGFGPYGEPLSTLKQGDGARLNFGSEDNDAVARNALTGGGTPLYDSTAVDLAKVEAITKRWTAMVGSVRTALTNEKGSAAANAAAAKAAFDTGMGSLKQDMRSVAKALAGGDVTSRSTQTRGGGATASFNYNTGQFSLQPIAEKPEAIFRLVTDCAPQRALTRLPEA